MTSGPNRLGELLRAHRARAGLTPEQLAEQAGVSVRAIWYLEKGDAARASAESARRLAEFVGYVPGEAGTLRIGVLGRLTLTAGRGPVDVGPLTQRALLGLLALRPNNVVTLEEMMSALWDEQPPVSPRATLYTYLARLRRALHPALPIKRVPRGYQLQIEDDGSLDSLRFDRLATRAGAVSASDPLAAKQLYAEALDCWRGEALADMPEHVRQHPAALALAQRRLAAALNYADLAMSLGTYEHAVLQLRRVADEDPLHGGLHEGLNARLMLALAGAGQPAVALGLFGDVRERLFDELGIPPGRELHEAHARIVQQETREAAADTLVPREVSMAGVVRDVKNELGGDHPASLAAVSYLAIVRRAGGHPGNALDLDQEVLDRYRTLLGDYHPRTLVARLAVAVDLAAVGRFADALAMDEATLHDARQVLGEDHPDTLLAAIHVAAGYAATDRAADATALGLDTLDRCRRVLGDEHPSTRLCAENLAVIR
ncbi:BTAD domain-containing putative transcriptional regulator [Kibdelosporangium phytohabitans]|uniref:Uncharacterized protein n=1 Tax=Kibdelosporangium phytohabitans TaxID=860235 RepID=A0A0N9IC11_9PSEU|nr:BTAD domain-containing putative transcriptional regulator [Kibdelosporangium phytohabitans]ALG12070.1 hypothetical protein AOZ06_39035 [Kibdelosporangium phytohabitans]MBE1463557.1 DNA-binding SARP family transcriptional activator [Kibdelosporangium phytohabitans]